MFTTLIVQPIFNLLVLIYGILPGHNFGLALIIFTVIIRLAMWPLVKRQLHQTKTMRKLQPELKDIKKAAKGDRQKEMKMTMELYKERGFNQFATIPIIIVQAIILFGLFVGLQRVIKDPQALVNFAYPALQNLPNIKELAGNANLFDNTLFGIVDLSRAALGNTGLYIPAMIIVIGSAVTQYFQSKQLLPSGKDSRSLRDILKQAGDGSQADQSEVNAAVGRSTRFLFPAVIFIATVNFASALGLYWFIGGLIAFIQQSIVLREDEEDLEAIANSKSAKLGKLNKKANKNLAGIPEAEVVETVAADPVAATPPKPKTTKAKKAAKRKRKK